MQPLERNSARYSRASVPPSPQTGFERVNTEADIESGPRKPSPAKKKANGSNWKLRALPVAMVRVILMVTLGGLIIMTVLCCRSDGSGGAAFETNGRLPSSLESSEGDSPSWEELEDVTNATTPDKNANYHAMLNLLEPVCRESNPDFWKLVSENATPRRFRDHLDRQWFRTWQCGDALLAVFVTSWMYSSSNMLFSTMMDTPCEEMPDKLSVVELMKQMLANCIDGPRLQSIVVDHPAKSDQYCLRWGPGAQAKKLEIVESLKAACDPNGTTDFDPEFWMSLVRGFERYW
jgi:hypothetical protein